MTYGNLFAWLLLLTYFLNPFRVYQPYLTYQINYEYISSVLCINKEKPEVECHGKCHLTKELKKVAEEESQKTSITRSSQMEEFPIEELTALSRNLFLLEEIKHVVYLNKEYAASQNISNPPPQS
jgi:hypothetical protein